MSERDVSDLVTTMTPKAKINGSDVGTGETPKPWETYQQGAATNSTAHCHIHTNSHYGVEVVRTAVSHGVKT